MKSFSHVAAATSFIFFFSSSAMAFYLNSIAVSAYASKNRPSVIPVTNQEISQHFGNTPLARKYYRGEASPMYDIFSILKKDNTFFIDRIRYLDNAVQKDQEYIQSILNKNEGLVHYVDIATISSSVFAFTSMIAGCLSLVPIFNNSKNSDEQLPKINSFGKMQGKVIPFYFRDRNKQGKVS